MRAGVSITHVLAIFQVWQERICKAAVIRWSAVKEIMDRGADSHWTREA